MGRRKPNFNSLEMEILLDCLELRQQLLTPDKLTTEERLKLWTEIADQVNLCGQDAERTAAEVKKRWADFRYKVKIKAEDVNSGKLDKQTSFCPLEQQTLQLLEKAKIAKTNGSVYLHSFVKEEINEELNNNDDVSINVSNAIESAQCSNSVPECIDCEEQEGSTAEKVPKQKEKKIKKISNKLTLPSILKMPGLTVLQEIPSELIKENSPLSQKRNRTEMEDSHVSDMMDMLWESQKELKKELKEIKRIMFRMSQQSRKRLQQENEKIQLKKMKIFLKCKKMGVDYEDFINECL